MFMWGRVGSDIVGVTTHDFDCDVHSRASIYIDYVVQTGKIVYMSQVDITGKIAYMPQVDIMYTWYNTLQCDYTYLTYILICQYNTWYCDFVKSMSMLMPK